MALTNRRGHYRLDYVTDVVIRYDEIELSAYCLNLSQGGMYVSCPPLPLGQKVMLTFTLPDIEETVETEALVRWNVREPRRGVGLQFQNLRPIEVWGINQLFRRRDREQG